MARAGCARTSHMPADTGPRNNYRRPPPLGPPCLRPTARQFAHLRARAGAGAAGGRPPPPSPLPLAARRPPTCRQQPSLPPPNRPENPPLLPTGRKNTKNNTQEHPYHYLRSRACISEGGRGAPAARQLISTYGPPGVAADDFLALRVAALQGCGEVVELMLACLGAPGSPLVLRALAVAGHGLLCTSSQGRDLLHSPRTVAAILESYGSAAQRRAALSVAEHEPLRNACSQAGVAVLRVLLDAYSAAGGRGFAAEGVAARGYAGLRHAAGWGKAGVVAALLGALGEPGSARVLAALAVEGAGPIRAALINGHHEARRAAPRRTAPPLPSLLPKPP